MFFLEYPNIRSLSLFHLLSLFACGARRIILLDQPGEGKWSSLQLRQLDQANTILEALFGLADRVLVSSLQDLDSHFTGDDLYQPARPFFSQEFGGRRENLVAILEFLVRQSGRQSQLSADDGHCLATLSCNSDKCTGCLACLNECRIGALSTDESGLILQHRVAMCVACGICVHVCPEAALSLTTGAVLGDTYFQTVRLAQADPMACRKCGKVFGTRKSFDRVMAILSNRETVDTEHFEYCEVCRVVRLFETQAQ